MNTQRHSHSMQNTFYKAETDHTPLNVDRDEPYGRPALSQDRQSGVLRARSINGPVCEMKVPSSRLPWNGVERRSANSCRRQSCDRRGFGERRQDTRMPYSTKRSLGAWIRSLKGGRLGVDRRKGVERRIMERRCSRIVSLVTQEELEALLR
ncbi:MAG: hypothetical protein ACI8ZB_004712 [Desulforhopalus sp.]|jgi:hypothetical protein